MDAELLELQRQFESAQQAKSSVRLSERNVVELVQKLQELRIIDFELLHTVSGKEYMTHDQLKLEMEMEVKKSGRVSLIDLSDIIGVDLYHIENQAQQVVSKDSDLMLVQGEIISQTYWDSVAEEINEKLQECSHISLAELAGQLHVGSEMIQSVIEPRIDTIVKGRLEGGQLYTPAYVSRVKAMVRGAMRGITVPTNLPTVWATLRQLLQEMNPSSHVSIENTFFQSLFNEMVKEGEVLGSLRAGVLWTPSVFAHAQRKSVESFFSQNNFINYDVLHKLAIPQPKQYLQSRYPDGITLDSVFVHPSMVEMTNAAIEDAVENGTWIDSLSILPASLGHQDAAKLLSYCPNVQTALKTSKAVILGETCIFSAKFIKDMFDKLEKELGTLSFTNLAAKGQPYNSNSRSSHKAGVAGLSPELDNDGDLTSSSRQNSQKGSKKKKGKGSDSGRSASTENDPDVSEDTPVKSKKQHRKGKDGGNKDASDPKTGTRHSNNTKENVPDLPSEEWVLEQIRNMYPDLEDFGVSDDPNALLRQLALHLRPMLIDSWRKKRNTLLMENVDRRRKMLDILQKHLDEAFLDMQLYEKGLDTFEDDPSTMSILEKHLLRTAATPMVDKLILYLDTDNKLMNGVEVEEPADRDARTLDPGERLSIAKDLSGAMSVKAQAVVEALEGKRLSTFMDALRAIAEESGISLKKLDKKLERTLLHSYRKTLTQQVSSETDPVALLPKAVALLYLQAHNKALQAPGRAIAVVLSRLKGKLAEPTYEVLKEYHSATVTLLALQAAATGDEDDCSADRILSKKELLEEKMPELKQLVLGNSESAS